MNTNTNSFIELMKIARHKLLERDFLTSLLTYTELLEIQIQDSIILLDDMGYSVPVEKDITKSMEKEIIVKTIMKSGGVHYAFLDKNGRLKHIQSKWSGHKGKIPKFTPPFDLYQKINLVENVIENYTNAGKHIETTIGRFILNYIPLASVFGDKIEFVNDLWNIGKIEQNIATLLFNKEATIDQYKQYIDRGYLLGHFTELFVPTMTEKSLTTDPAIAKRKKELLEKYKGRLNDPQVIGLIEDELIAMDKKWLKGDDALGYHKGIGGKSFNVHRKKLFLTVGGIESFDKDTGEYNFISNSLSEGWDKKDFATISNEIRKGSYARGKETAEGGALTKFVLRVFQDLKITKEDCKTKRGIKTLVSSDLVNELSGRHTVTGDVITDENKSSFIGKEVKLRSPLYCETKDGLCYVCSGDKLKTLETEAVGVLAVDITSKFMLASMKQMHNSSISLKDVEYSDYFR